MNTNYPVMEIYINGSTTADYTLAVSGSQTIGSTTYTTTSGADDLNFASTTTTVGTEYIHTITTDTLGLTGSTLSTLTSGVWKFKCLDASETTNIFVGGIITEDIECCMASKLDKAFNTNPKADDNDAIKDVQLVWAILESAKSSAALGSYSNAEYKYSIAEQKCEGCGCV